MQNEPKEVRKAREYCDVKTDKFEVEKTHWVSCSGDSEWGDAECGDSESRCYDCAKKRAEEYTKKTGKKMMVDGGYSIQEVDTCEHCVDCGKVLSYSLTECGVESELEHFLDQKTDIDVTDIEECYHLLQVFELYNCYEKQQEGILELAKKVCGLIQKR